MATPVRIIITAAILIATMGISHAQDKPKSKVLRIGIPYPYHIENPSQDEEPLAIEFLTDLIIGTYSEDVGVNWRKKEQPLYFNRQRIFPPFSIIEERDGGKTFFAELKPNIFFHDGSVATVDDVEFSLARHPERSAAIQRIKFTKLSSRTFTLSSDRSEYWGKLLDIALKKRGRVGEKSISAGPYIVTSVDRRKKFVRLKAFEKYVNGPPLVPEIEYTFYENSNMAMFGFLADETDFICGLSPGQERITGNITSKKVMRYASNTVFILAFNITKPPMDDILVRKAISLLIDRHSLIAKSEYLRNAAIPTQHQFAMSSPVTKAHADSPAPVEAFKLLQKAGYTRTVKGWEKDGKPIRISMQIPAHLSTYIPEARIVSRWLNETGLNINFELTSMDDRFNPQVINRFHIIFSSIYDRLDMEGNREQFEPSGPSNLFQSANLYPMILLAGSKSGSLTAKDKETVIRKISDFSYSAPLFYPVDFCAGKKNFEYEDVFFRSPVLYSIINRTAPSDLLQSQTGPK
ncbi:MAG: hypothetical protein HQK86_15205 [Nitrospinae bacterium]|nr:hypothetical protein [Nitrospinota bacterium]